MNVIGLTLRRVYVKSVTRLCGARHDLTFRLGGGLVSPIPVQERKNNEKRLRDLCASLCDHVSTHAAHELPVAGSARDHGTGAGLFCLPGPRAWARHPSPHWLECRGG